MAEPITVGIVIGYVADTLAKALIKEEGYGRIAGFLKKSTYRNRLSRLIAETINEFQKENPIQEANGKAPFYNSQKIIDELFKFVLFGKDEDKYHLAIKNDPNYLKPTKKQREDFCRKFISKVKGDKKLRKLAILENYQERIFLLDKKVDQFISDSRDFRKDIKGLLTPLRDEVKGIAEYQGFNPIVEYGSHVLSRGQLDANQEQVHRSEALEAITNQFQSNPWIHIYGGTLTGKSTLAIQLAKKQSEQVEYIKLFSISKGDLVGFLYTQLVSRIGLSGHANPSLIESTIRQRFEGTCFVFDEIRNTEIQTEELATIIGLIDCIIKGGARVVSVGQSKLSIGLGSSHLATTPCLVEAPSISELEVEALLSKHDCPKIEDWKQLVFSLSKGNWAIAVAIVDHIQSKSWQFDLDLLKQIYSGEYGNNLKEEAFKRVIDHRFTDQQRDLLYRLAIPFEPIDSIIIDYLANIDPVIPQIKAKLRPLLGVWVQETESHYQVSPVITTLKISDLGSVALERMNRALGVRILNKKMFSPFEAWCSIQYFTRAKDFELAGFVLIIALRDMLENLEPMTEWGLHFIWLRVKLPNEISIEKRIIIRLHQIQIMVALDDKEALPFLIGDLQELVLEGEQSKLKLGIAYSLLAALTGEEENTKYLLKAFESDFFDYISYELLEKKRLEEVVFIFIANARKSGSIVEFWQAFERLNPAQRKRLQESEIADLSCLMFPMGILLYYNSIPSNDKNWEEALEKLSIIQQKAAENGLEIMEVKAAIVSISILVEILKRTDAGKQHFERIYEKYEDNENYRFTLLDTLGRALYFIQADDEARPLILEAVDLNVSGIFDEKRYSFYIASRLLTNENPEASLNYMIKAKEAAQQSKETTELDVVKYYGEIGTAYWKVGKREKAIRILEIGFETIFEIQNLDDNWKITLVRLSHSFNYYGKSLLTGKPPELDWKGEPYDEPNGGMYFMPIPANLGEFYFAQRRFMACYMLLDFFEASNDFKISKKWALRLRDFSKESSVNPYFLLASNSLPYLVIDQKFAEALRLLIEIHDFLLKLFNNENLAQQVDHELPRKVLERSHTTHEPDFVETLYCTFIVPAIFHLLSNAAGDMAILKTELRFLEDWLKDVLSESEFDKHLQRFYEVLDLFTLDKVTVESVRIHDSQDTSSYSKYCYVIRHLLAAEVLPTKDSVMLHASIIELLETHIKPLSRGSYIFSILPYFVSFWNRKFESDRKIFRAQEHWEKKSKSYFENAKWENQLRHLFEALHFHFQFPLTPYLEKWLDG